MADDPVFRELEERGLRYIQSSLLKDKGGESQRRFLESLSDADAFAALIKEYAAMGGGDAPPIFGGILTEGSFKEFPEDQEAAIYGLWRDVPPRTACRVSFWAGVALEHIEAGRMQPSWLAANGGVSESGAKRVERALYDGGKEMDDCVRTALRRMSGLPAARGNRSVFVDCSFARAWWRERIIARVMERTGGGSSDRFSLREVVRVQARWESLVTMIVSRGSVFGSEDVQDAFINELAKRYESNSETSLKSDANLRLALRRFANLSAAREIGALDFGEISAVVADLIERFDS